MHTCELLVISCIDYRFQNHIRNFLENEYSGNYDFVSLAGSAMNFTSKDTVDSKVIIKQIQISKNLHKIKKIFIFNHQNCGAYGNLLVSGSQKEKEMHKKDLIIAKETISNIFPDLEIYTYFIEFKNEPITTPIFAPLP